MRVLLKFIVDCEPDVAWAAIRSPEASRSVAAPLLRFRSLEPDGLPVSWPAGTHPVAASLFGLVDVRAGALTPLVWFGLWAFWQWRGIRLRAILQGKGLAGNSRAAAGG